MTSSVPRSRAGWAVLALCTATLGLVAPSALAVQPPPPEQPVPPVEKQLDARDRALITEAEQAGKAEVTIMVAAEAGKSDAAANELRGLGSVVKTIDKQVDYLRVSLPPAAARKAVKLNSVRAIDVDGIIARDEPVTEGATDPSPQPAPGANTPRVNPYMPTGDTKAAQFSQLFPFWDGKGVTIGVVDSGIDLDHPALATTSGGQRKIVDWHNTNPVDSGDGTWVAMSKATFTGSFNAGGRAWKAPATGGPYSIGLFNESASSIDLGAPTSEIGGDVNRDGDRTDRFGVLQDVATKQVRVDLDQDGDFTDEQPMIDYGVQQDVGHFGTDNPATPAIERVAFVVQTDKSIYGTADTPFVNIGIAGAAHGSHVSGIAAGNALLGGKMAGAAPGANLLAVKACFTTSSCTNVGMIEGVIYAAERGADVVNVSIGSLPALNDGNGAQTTIYNRVIEKFNVQVFFSAGNSGSGANTIGDPSVASDVVSVGSYITSATWLSNYGSKTANKQNLHPFSSRGPSEDGGFKPNIIAPGSAISSIPQWQPQGAVPGTYVLPTGYGHLQGTSMASPQATGAAALLVSAYKATHGGKRPSVGALRNAIYSSAKYNNGFGAYEQGNGLFDVFGAFFQLASAPNPDTITSSVEVHTVLDGLLPKPGFGVGIHDREGVVRGKKFTRTYTFTRTSGNPGTVPYRLRWVGNDGTFSSGDYVSLPLNKPVKVDVRVDPRDHGLHTAVLQLDNPFTRGIDGRTMNTVFVPQEFNAGNKFTFTTSGKIARNQTKNFFVRVPEGTTGLKIDLQGGGSAAGAGQVRFIRVDPRGIPIDPTGTTSCYNPDAGAACTSGSVNTRTVNNPIAGVWEVYVEARRTSDVAEAPFSLTASAITTKISPNPDNIDSAQLGVPLPRNYTVSSTAAAFTGKLAGAPLSSALTQRPKIAQDEEQDFDINVLPGATSLRVSIKNPVDAAADLDLVVLNCTSGTCVQAGVSADGDSDESVTINNPAAGRWVAAVQGFSIPAGSTDYDYEDVFASPSLGNVTVNDTDQLRPIGTSWNVPGTLTVLAPLPTGRKLGADLVVRTSDGGIVGNGSVRINSVS